jgi:prepilin-type N-terminal cleavage/methylation domain-containing protein
MIGMTRRVRSRRGFTMVELLVVIIIISVLVAIALPRYFAAIYAGRVRACQSNFKIINTAVQAYFAQNKEWPTAVTDMLSPDDAAKTGTGIGGQLTEMPLCPFDATDKTFLYDLDAILADGTLSDLVDPAGGDPANPVSGVVTRWEYHWPAMQWQSATTHLQVPVGGA